MGITAKPDSVFAVTHASYRIALLRRYRVSEVCLGGDFLLAFAHHEKAAAINRRYFENCCTSAFEPNRTSAAPGRGRQGWG
jgi:hypothetical protein